MQLHGVGLSRPYPGLCLPWAGVENSPAGPAIWDLLCFQTKASWKLSAHSTCWWISFFSPRIIMACCCCFSVAQSSSPLCDPMDCGMPGFPVLHHLPELAQTQVHGVGDAIQLSHPVTPFSSCPQSSPASGAFPVSWLFASGGLSTAASASASDNG